MHVLKGAMRTDAQFAIFSSVGGNQFGIPQSQAKTVETSSQSTQKKELQSLELELENGAF